MKTLIILCILAVFVAGCDDDNHGVSGSSDSAPICAP